MRTLYIYALVPVNSPLPEERGINGADLHIVSAPSGVAAVVHTHDAAPYEGPDDDVKRWVLQHSDVVEACWSSAASVLPVSFNVIVRPDEDGGATADDQLQAWLNSAGDELRTRLDELEGSSELRVEISLDPDEFAQDDPSVAQLREEMESRPAGVRRLLEKRLEKLQKQLTDQAADRLYPDYRQRIAQHSSELQEYTSAQHAKGLVRVLSAACLLRADRIEDLGAELSAIQDEAPGTRIRFLGPWPPTPSRPSRCPWAASALRAAAERPARGVVPCLPRVGALSRTGASKGIQHLSRDFSGTLTTPSKCSPEPHAASIRLFIPCNPHRCLGGPMPPHRPPVPIDPTVSKPDTTSQLMPVVRPAADEEAEKPKKDPRRKPREQRRGRAPKKQAFDPSAFEQRADTRHIFRRVIEPVQTATAVLPLVDRLTGTPYANPILAEQTHEADELETINFVLDLGETLFRYGAGAFDVETSIIAVTAAYGMDHTDVDITNQSIIFNWAPEEVPYSRVRVVRSWSGNFRALCELHQMVTDIITGRVTRAQAKKRLRDIRRQPKPYARWVVTVSGALFAGLFASYTGAPPLDAFLGFAATLLVLGITRQLHAWRVPEIFTLAVSGFAATSVALSALWLGADITPSMVVAGGLMILLPSVRIVNAMQDVIHSFPITAAYRLVSTLVSFAGMTAGIMTAVIVADVLGAPEVEIVQGITHLYHPSALAVLVLATGVTAAIVEQAPGVCCCPPAQWPVWDSRRTTRPTLSGWGSGSHPSWGCGHRGARPHHRAAHAGAHPRHRSACHDVHASRPHHLPRDVPDRPRLLIRDDECWASPALHRADHHSGDRRGIALGDVLMRPVTSRMRQTRYVVDRRDQMEELASAAAGSS
ncbi:threonine/serine exporter family protein [Nesterenkonia pannonica]|uniref:GvpL/GvpF family gas vesicle protein n=1 Tax=Nesterenkonia pannonica TaxID=1548602 RepID=UPI002164DE05|nr:GvpL/GvpF family gas vesicle protein [Nesterenkonia pannonica]